MASTFKRVKSSAASTLKKGAHAATELAATMHITQQGSAKFASHTEQSGAVEKAIGALGRPIITIAVNMRRLKKKKSKEMKKRFIGIVDVMGKSGGELVIAKASGAEEASISQRIKVSDVVKVEGGIQQQSEEFSIVASKVTMTCVARSRDERDEFVYLLGRCWREIKGKPLPMERIQLAETVTQSSRVRRRESIMEASSSGQEQKDKQSESSLDILTEHERLALASLVDGGDIEAIDAFIERQGDDQALLEHANIHSLLSSEDLVQSVVTSTAELGTQLAEMDDFFSSTEKMMQAAKSDIASLARRNGALEMQFINTRKLEELIERLSKSLQIPLSVSRSLCKADWSDPDQVEKAQQAASRLLEQMSADIPEKLHNTMFVTKQKQEMQNVQNKFLVRLREYLTNILSDSQKSSSKRGAKLSSSLMELHTNVRPVQPLIALAAKFDESSIQDLRALYLSTVRPLAQDAFTAARGSKASGDGPKFETRITYTADAPIHPPATKTTPIFDNTHAIGDVLTGVVKMLKSEQTFMRTTFCYSSSTDSSLQNALESVLGDVSSTVFNLCQAEAKADSALLGTMLCECEVMAESIKNDCPAAKGILQQVIVLLRAAFNEWVESLISALKAIKVSPKKAGIPSPIRKFPTVLLILQRHMLGGILSPLETSMPSVVVEIFSWLQTIAAQDPKYSAIFLAENYAFLASHLRSSSLECLAEYAESAQKLSDSSVSAYCAWIVHCEFEELDNFLKQVGIQMKNVPAHDIQFTQSLTRQEMRKVSRAFSPQLMDKHVRSMHSRIRKHISPEMGMFWNVWRSVQNHTLKLHQRLCDVAKDCYASEGPKDAVAELTRLFAAGENGSMGGSDRVSVDTTGTN